MGPRRGDRFGSLGRQSSSTSYNGTGSTDAQRRRVGGTSVVENRANGSYPRSPPRTLDVQSLVVADMSTRDGRDPCEYLDDSNCELTVVEDGNGGFTNRLAFEDNFVVNEQPARLRVGSSAITNVDGHNRPLSASVVNGSSPAMADITRARSNSSSSISRTENL